MRKKIGLALCLVLVFAVNVHAAEIIRIGIMNFYSRANGVSNYQAAAITDIFTRMLASSKVIAIVERDRLEAIGREQRFNMSGLVDSGTAVRIGRIAGCQYILLGSVTSFSKTAKTSGFGNLFQETNINAEITIDMRVIDVTTSEVVMSMAETGTATQKISQTNFGDIKQSEANLEGIESEAIENAVSKLGQRIRESVAGEYSQVLSVAGSDIILNVGASSGAGKGRLYKVYADGFEIFDMDGNVIGNRNINIAVIQISEVQNDFSVARIIKDGGRANNIRRGDKITPISSGEAKDLVKKKLPKERPSGARGRHDDLDAELAQASASTLTASEVPPAKKPILSKSSYENRSTDPSKVIPTYGLPSGEANTLRIQHINARRLGNSPKAYKAYVEMADANSVDYLAAFRAGEIASSLGKKAEAKEWIERALSINPNYKPAQEAKERLENRGSSKPKKRRK